MNLLFDILIIIKIKLKESLKYFFISDFFIIFAYENFNTK
jgi:hypothetical protein